MYGFAKLVFIKGKQPSNYSNLIVMPHPRVLSNFLMTVRACAGVDTCEQYCAFWFCFVCFDSFGQGFKFRFSRESRLGIFIAGAITPDSFKQHLQANSAVVLILADSVISQSLTHCSFPATFFFKVGERFHCGKVELQYMVWLSWRTSCSSVVVNESAKQIYTKSSRNHVVI